MLSLIDRDAGFQPTKHRDIQASLILSLVSSHRERHPDVVLSCELETGDHVGAAGKLKITRHHSDYADRVAIQRQTLSQHIVVGGEFSLPEAITNNCHGRCALLILFRRESL